MTLKEKFIALYKKAFQTKEEPTILDLAKLANVLGSVLEHPQAEQELGADVIAVLKKCVKIKRRSVEVELSTLLNEIKWYEDGKEEQE